MSAKHWILLGALAVAACRSDASSIPYYRSAELTPEWLPSSDTAAVHRIPDFTLTDQDGRTFTQDDLTGHIVVASFFYTRCTTMCPTVELRMAALQKKYMNDPRVILVSHSVTPELDSVPVLERYAEAHDVVETKWHLLTGTSRQIYDLAKSGYYVELSAGASDAPGTNLKHTETLVLLDGDRHIRGVYSGTLLPELDRLNEDLAQLLAQS